MNRNTTSFNEILRQYKDEVTTMLKSLANPYRLEILVLLSNTRAIFKEIQDRLNLSKTATSHHLEVLLNAKMINHMSRGNYEISFDGSAILNSMFTTFLHTQQIREEEFLRKSNYILRTHTKRSEKMSELDVRIVDLEPMQVASVQAISKTPENDAWIKMKNWAKPQGLLENLEKHPVFGFNNPNPSQDKPEYGYEFWIKLDPDTNYGPSGSDVEFKKFDGGKFAVATSKLKEDIDTDGVLKTWKKLVTWVETSNYDADWDIQCLEKALTTDVSEDDLVIDLYLPIKSK